MALYSKREAPTNLSQPYGTLKSNMVHGKAQCLGNGKAPENEKKVMGMSEIAVIDK